MVIYQFSNRKFLKGGCTLHHYSKCFQKGLFGSQKTCLLGRDIRLSNFEDGFAICVPAQHCDERFGSMLDSNSNRLLGFHCSICNPLCSKDHQHAFRNSTRRLRY